MRLALLLFAVVVLAAPAAVAATTEQQLRRHAPVLVLDAREPSGPVAVDAFLRGRRSVTGPSRVYGHAVRDRGRLWLQYWLFYPDNPQDRGIVRTGRHIGDWEIMQVGLDRAGRPADVTFAQHAWRQACGWSDVDRAGGAPVGYVAHASHATYPRAGTADRPWPDPNDEARADGLRVRPPVAVITATTPAWVASRERFGASRAAWWNPAEASSPRGPRFQPEDRFTRPAAFSAGARSCASGPPGHPWWLWAGLGAGTALAAWGVRRRLRGRTA